jgi:hypothetical protein
MEFSSVAKRPEQSGATPEEVGSGPVASGLEKSPGLEGSWRSTLAVGVIGFCWTLALCLMFGEAAARLSIAGKWYESDGWRVFDDMAVLEAVHPRIHVHPAFSAIAMPLTLGLARVFPIRIIEVIWLINAMTAGLCLAIFYATLRKVGCRALDAYLFSGLACVSSAWLFWYSVPETFGMGALSLVFCFWLAARISRGELVSTPTLLAAVTLSAGITLSNLMAGCALLVTLRQPKRATAIFCVSILAVGLLMGAQRLAFVSTSSFRPSVFGHENNYFLHEHRIDSLHVVQSELLHSMIHPKSISDSAGMWIVQPSMAFSDLLAGRVAVVLWSILFALGLVALVTGPAPGDFRFVLGSVLAGQIVLHLLYGEETFLYSLHFAVILIMVAAQASLTRLRVPALLATAVLLLLIGGNNFYRLDQDCKTGKVPESDQRLPRLLLKVDTLKALPY